MDHHELGSIASDLVRHLSLQDMCATSITSATGRCHAALGLSLMVALLLLSIQRRTGNHSTYYVYELNAARLTITPSLTVC